jgi:malto-oligosyltrehalose trehalohydrolase
MKHRHNMPFGAECQTDGCVRFRLWAPAAGHVDLVLLNGDDPLLLPLHSLGSGWFELVTDAAKAGSLYRFRVTNLSTNTVQDVPDPASRFQPQDVHGPSEVIHPQAYDWQDDAWPGRRWEEAVIYELHTGAFTKAGTFYAVENHLDYLAHLGITALELMPVSDFPGQRNWGYDGVFPFAPDSTYGRPEDLKSLVQAAHARGMMIFLDVVYNHFGPEGNYLGIYAPQFFTDHHKTPWGNAINFDAPGSRTVRDFFIHNVLYWLNEYRFDGLRFDAVHEIHDDSTPDILTELAVAVHDSVEPDHQVHLILENERNQSSRLRRTPDCKPHSYTAQWDDDIHHTLHVLTTGERDGYYSDYSVDPLGQLGRCLTSGFAYQGDISLYSNGQSRGECTNGLPLTAFISFLQNHDQIGNRAFGDRLLTLADPRAFRAALAVVLLAPLTPLIFMGEEFGAQTPFLFFCDFGRDLAAAITAGRRNEFARFTRFSDPEARKAIPDPNAASTFESSRLDWDALKQDNHQGWLTLYRRLLTLRFQEIVPHLSGACRVQTAFECLDDRCFTAAWTFADAAKLTLLANLKARSVSMLTPPGSRLIYASEGTDALSIQQGTLPAWSVAWFLDL